ncbi:LPS export ABC transporter periplasmic protein LptC [uncultured Sphingomonas sp.]|uniref:LPS export ABC transporter periplasmic protein LptC n=1 Tax=uncultured Sphingomonas sp. TaxID=158754 RepID=UPI0025FFC8B4|nr:LPS export ABC transporter periplasmic protein LptC [uncultured Sphingomonas sp.]
MSRAANAERTARQRWAMPGSSHDKFVALLQFALPVGIGVLAAFLVMAPLFMGGDVSFVLDKNKVAVAQERMKLEAAQYRGQDAKGQAFTLDAASAVQRSSAEPVVQLATLSAGLAMRDGPAKITAPSGLYDMRSEQVKIDGPIDFTAADGYRLGTTGATVDLKTRKMLSDGAVQGSTPMGTFSANRLSADLEGRVVRLEGNARLRIVPKNANRR